MDEYEKLTRKNIDLLSRQQNINLANKVSGGVSGAITNPESKEAEKHAKMYYEEIRHMTTDVKRISENTNFTESQIMLVKNYLFVAEHELFGGFRRFDPCFEIAESWRRLAFDKDNIQAHDIILIKHELKEMGLVAQGVSQEAAHEIASHEYDYAAGYKAFYKQLGLKIQKKDKDLTSGAVSTKRNKSKPRGYEYSRW